MSGTSAKVARYRFGPFDLDPSEGTLSRNGIRVRLQDLPYRLLLMLVERPGEIVTREESARTCPREAPALLVTPKVGGVATGAVTLNCFQATTEPLLWRSCA